MGNNVTRRPEEETKQAMLRYAQKFVESRRSKTRKELRDEFNDEKRMEPIFRAFVLEYTGKPVDSDEEDDMDEDDAILELVIRLVNYARETWISLGTASERAT